MLPAPFKVVLDANVLYPFSLRDTLLRAASEGLFQLYWSDQILEEARPELGQFRKNDHAAPRSHGRSIPGGDGDGPRAADRGDEERREGQARSCRRGEGR